MELDPQALFSAVIVVATMLLVGFPVHEALHAWTAMRLGDNTARWMGRVSLDPRVHFDQMGALITGRPVNLEAELRQPDGTPVQFVDTVLMNGVYRNNYYIPQPSPLSPPAWNLWARAAASPPRTWLGATRAAACRARRQSRS